MEGISFSPRLDWPREQNQQHHNMSKEGFVDGIDVIQQTGTTRCLAFINSEPGSPDYIQVETTNPQLQSALEAASIAKTKVEVSYEQSNGLYSLTRVRLLDRA